MKNGDTGRQNSRFVIQIVVSAILGVAAILIVLIWFYNHYTFTILPKRLNSVGCPGNKVYVMPHNGNIWDKKCVGYDNKGRVDCSGITQNSSYRSVDGHTGGCYRGHTFPAFN